MYVCYYRLCVCTCMSATVAQMESSLSSPLQVAMSQFDPDKYIPYEQLSNNLKIVRDRSAILCDQPLCSYM